MGKENKRGRERWNTEGKKKRCKGKALHILERVVLFSIVLLGATEVALSADQNWHPKITRQELFLTAIIVCTYFYF